MKLALTFFLLSALSLQADLIRKEEFASPKSVAKNIIWTRDGVKIMTACPRGDAHFLLYIISLKKGGAALMLSFSSRHLRMVASGPALLGYNFAIDDFTHDGNPDFIQITDPKTQKVIEAFTILYQVA